MPTLAPNLPKDALSRVFSLAEPIFDDFGVTSIDFEYYRHFTWAQHLSSVCRNWRTAFIESPELWTTIIWRPRRKEYIRAALQRSGKLSIRVYALSGMEDEGSYEYDLGKDDSEDEAFRIENNMPKIAYLNTMYEWDRPDPPIQASTRGKYYDPDDFFEDIGKHLDRVKSFHLTIPGFRMRILYKHFNKPAPVLETLTLGTSRPSYDDSPKIVPRLFDGQATSLKHLTLKHYEKWPIVFANALTHLSLVHLNLNDLDVYRNFLDTLHVAHKLEVLVVDPSGSHPEFERTPNGRAPVRMDNLRNLAIQSATPTGASNLLALIALPPTACISLCITSGDEKLDHFFPKDRTHLRNLPDPYELVLLWEMADYASPMIKSRRNGLPVYASTAVPIDDLSSYLRKLGKIFDLRNIRRLSSYQRLGNELRDHRPSVWRKVLQALPNLEAIHLYGYDPSTLLDVLPSPNGASEMDNLREEYDALQEMAVNAGAEADEMAERYEEAEENVRKNLQPYTSLTVLSPYLHHIHKLDQTTPLDVMLNGNPAEVRITHGCRWQHETKGDHEAFVEMSVILRSTLANGDGEMTMTAREEISIIKPWWQDWHLYFGTSLVVPSLLSSPYEQDW